VAGLDEQQVLVRVLSFPPSPFIFFPLPLFPRVFSPPVSPSTFSLFFSGVGVVQDRGRLERYRSSFLFLFPLFSSFPYFLGLAFQAFFLFLCNNPSNNGEIRRQTVMPFFPFFFLPSPFLFSACYLTFSFAFFGGDEGLRSAGEFPLFFPSLLSYPVRSRFPQTLCCCEGDRMGGVERRG